MLIFILIRCSWARLLEPTIQFTREGFPVHTMLERNLDVR